MTESTFEPPVSEPIVYPESDGLPIADNTVQFRLITTIHAGLDALLSDTFVAADLLWYPVEGDPTTSAAPDVMVAFGRPKGDRRSYLQWLEENIAPQVVFEIASSPTNPLETLVDKKLKFYERHDVDEYYVFDPDFLDVGIKQNPILMGWLRDEDRLQPISQMNGWVSPRLKVRFEVKDGELQLYRPYEEPFATYAEIIQQKRQERERAERAETQAAIFAQRLRELGVNPEELLARHRCAVVCCAVPVTGARWPSREDEEG